MILPTAAVRSQQMSKKRVWDPVAGIRVLLNALTGEAPGRAQGGKYDRRMPSTATLAGQKAVPLTVSVSLGKDVASTATLNHPPGFLVSSFQSS